MGFVLKKCEFFCGRVIEPGGDGEVTIVPRGTRASAVRKTLMEAERRNWDWVIDLRRDPAGPDEPHETVATWSSMAGDLPPSIRTQVPGL